MEVGTARIHLQQDRGQGLAKPDFEMKDSLIH